MKTRLFTAITLGLATASMAILPMAAQAQEATTDYNYVGAGVGISEDIGLSVNSKITVADNVSVRPGVITDFSFEDRGTVFLAPVTYDFEGMTEGNRLLPFVGGGVSVSTGSEGEVSPLLTGGADYRINDKLTAYGAVNWSITDSSQVSGSVGLGYTF